jgi:hypothetical protein
MKVYVVRIKEKVENERQWMNKHLRGPPHGNLASATRIKGCACRHQQRVNVYLFVYLLIKGCG